MSASNRSQSPSAGAGMWKKVALVIAVLAIAVAAVVFGWQALSDDGTEQASPRTPDPAPNVLLTSVDQEVWVPGPADRSQIPVLLYHGIGFPSDFSNTEDSNYGLDPDEFAKQMALLRSAGYQTVTLDQFVGFHRGDEVSLPPHPLLLTFDDARADSWTGGDGILRELGFNAVMFVDVGRVDREDPEYLTWSELDTVQASGRWELQLHSGEGHQQIQYGPADDDVGPFYAYEEEGEGLGGWRERALGDIRWGQGVLSTNIPSYRPRAFAPPYGSYGQDGTNNPQIPEELLPWLVNRYDIVFTQDQSIFAKPGQAQPLGRLQITRDMTGGQLHEWLVGERTQ